MKPSFTAADTIGNLDSEQLEVIARTQVDLVLDHFRETAFDVERMRIMLELGIAEADRRLAELQESQATVERPSV